LRHARAAAVRPVPAGRGLEGAQAAPVPETLRPGGPARIVSPMSASAVPGAFPATAIPRSPVRDPGSPRAHDVVAVAEALGIPWERLLEAEIQAERTLRGFVGEPGADLPFWRFLSALPTSALDSWRVRERLSALVRDARLSRSGAAVRSVRQAIDELCGKRSGGAVSQSDALALHLTLAHERVRELARVARAAERCRGESAHRLARIVEKTGATEADAAWAIRRSETPGKTHAIDDAVRQARAEGFEIPLADSEFHAFLMLRKLARRNRPARPRFGVSARRRRPAPRAPLSHRGSRRLAS